MKTAEDIVVALNLESSYGVVDAVRTAQRDALEWFRQSLHHADDSPVNHDELYELLTMELSNVGRP